MENQTQVKVKYAFNWADIQRDELGQFPPMSLDKALSVAKKMLKGKYVYVEIRKLR